MFIMVSIKKYIPSRRFWLIVITLVVALIPLVLSLLKVGSGSSVRPDEGHGLARPVISVTKTDAVAEQAALAVGVKPAMPAPTVAQDLGVGMVALNLRFDAAGKLTEAGSRQQTTGGKARAFRSIEGKAGLYHRIVGLQGQVLFENVVPDPRDVHWDTSTDGKKLTGGVAHFADMPLNLRLPVGVHGKLEVFLFKTPGWTRPTFDQTAQLLGTFDL